MYWMTPLLIEANNIIDQLFQRSYNALQTRQFSTRYDFLINAVI